MTSQNALSPWIVTPNLGADKRDHPYFIDAPNVGDTGFRPAIIMGDGALNRGLAEANARLIAAAPDLLAAAQRVAGISWSVGGLAFDDAITNLRAAIAKATGGKA